MTRCDDEECIRAGMHACESCTTYLKEEKARYCEMHYVPAFNLCEACDTWRCSGGVVKREGQNGAWACPCHRCRAQDRA